MRRLGILLGYAESDPEAQARLETFRSQLKKLGWAENGNLQIDYRWAPAGTGRQAFAKQLVSLQPDVIFAHSTPVCTALREETTSIPVVFVNVTDPIGSKLIVSLARPGGNFTGLTHFVPSMASKWLQSLLEIAPGTRRVALIYNPKTAPFVATSYMPAFEAASKSFGVDLVSTPIDKAEDIEGVMTGLGSEPGCSLIVVADIFTSTNYKIIVASAARHRFPAIYPFRFFVADGGLISYGIDMNNVFGRAAYYVDRVLRGAKPSELPVEAPIKFELVINHKTAKALGLTVLLIMQMTADEVIE
jgi:putative ABC transport system substrate-binding protein